MHLTPALVDVQVFVLDVAGGGDVARKGGPGIERADLLVVNKTDLAPYVGVDVGVGAGRTLEIVEPGGTVAYAMRGRTARWDVDVEVESGGTLVWHGEPFVVAHGADVRRATRVDLAAGASVVLRETLVLGRHGEVPGHLVARTDVRRDGAPVLVEELDPTVGLGPHRVLDRRLCLGTGCVGDGLVLESGDRLHRWLGTETHASALAGCQSSPREE